MYSMCNSSSRVFLDILCLHEILSTEVLFYIQSSLFAESNLLVFVILFSIA